MDPARQRWLELSLCWLAGQFGTDALHRGVVVSGEEFVSADGYPSADQVETLFGRLCDRMDVDPGSVWLELFDGLADKNKTGTTGRDRAVGLLRAEDGRAVVAVDTSMSADPQVLVPIIVHELGHLRLIGEGRVGRDRSDGERLTDLVTVCFGFGVLSANAALRFARAGRGWSIMPSGEFDDRTLNGAWKGGSHRLGYLTSEEFGYALACYGWLRGEREPAWAVHVDPGPRVVMEQGLAYLASSCAPGELPTQRLLGTSVEIGGAEVRIARGRTLRLGSLVLTIPDAAGTRSSADLRPRDLGAG